MNISSFDIKEKFKSVKNVVMQVTPVEAKVRACTSNDPWGAKSTDKSEVAEATYNFEDYKIVMQTIWKRMSDTGKDWRHVYKALQLLEYLIVHGSERVHEEAKDSLYTIRSLRSFRYVDEKGKDYGEGIRELAKKMVKFIQDEKQVQEEREKAKALSGKYSGFSRAESRYQGGSKSRSQPRRYDDEDDRPQRKKTYDDDDEDDRPQRRPQTRPSQRDDDEDDSPPVQRKPQRNIFEGDEEDSYSTRRQESRQDSRREDTSSRPRAPSNGATPPSNARKPRPPSPDFEAPAPQRTVPSQKPQSKPTAGVADFFGPSQDSFFDDDNFGSQGGQQGGFNPRTGGQQQQQDFDANFDNDFNDDFPEDEFGNYKGGEAPEKKDNLFSITEGLVNFDLNDTKKPTQGGQSGPLQPTNASTGSNQPLTLSQKAKLQGKKIPTTTNMGRGAPTGMLPPQGGGFGGMPPQGGGFGGMPPQGGGFGGMPPQGGGYGGPPQGGGFGGMPPQGGGYGGPPQGGFGGQPQYPPMGRGVPPPQGGGFQGGFGGQPQGGFNQGFGGQPQGGFGGQPQGGFNQGFGGQPQGGGRGQPQFGGQPQGMGRGAPQNRPPVINNNDPFF